MPVGQFVRFRKRSELGDLKFTECHACGDTVIRTTVKATLRDQSFDPRPVAGGSEIDPMYDTHECKKEAT